MSDNYFDNIYREACPPHPPGFLSLKVNPGPGTSLNPLLYGVVKLEFQRSDVSWQIVYYLCFFYESSPFLSKTCFTDCLQNLLLFKANIGFHFRHLGHLCGQAIMIGRTRGDGPTKARKQRKIHSARRALWRRFREFGVDWELLDMRDKILDMKHARRTSNQKCKIKDVHRR